MKRIVSDGQWLRYLREKKGLEQKEVQERANISRQVLYYIERGANEPSKRMAKRLKKFFGSEWDTPERKISTWSELSILVKKIDAYKNEDREKFYSYMVDEEEYVEKIVDYLKNLSDDLGIPH